MQEFRPTTHLIIEPHPDVLAHAKSKGWFDKPGVRFFEGTWQAYLQAQEDEKEPYLLFDSIYFGAPLPPLLHPPRLRIAPSTDTY